MAYSVYPMKIKRQIRCIKSSADQEIRESYQSQVFYIIRRAQSNNFAIVIEVSTRSFFAKSRKFFINLKAA